MTRRPDISVIVPVRNGGDDVRALLRALDRQTLEPGRFEVIIGDDGSTDGSLDGLSLEHARLTVSPGPPQNSYAARNRAVRASAGTVLAFCDGDCVPAPDWLERGVRELERCDVVAGLIRHRLPEHLSVWSLVDMDQFLDQERSVRAGVAVTANLFLRRELFDRVGGFDDSIPEHGDHDFVARCVASGADLRFAEEVEVGHPTRDRARVFLRKFWIMNRWYGVRARRRGERPDALSPRAWVPVVRTWRGRRWYGRSLGLDSHRLNVSGAHPGTTQRLLAVPIIYLLLPYLAVAAQLRGWRDV